MIRAASVRPCLFTVMVALLQGCGGDSPTSTPPGGKASAPSVLQAVSGGNQSAVVASELPNALVVKVTAVDGSAAARTTVTWEVPSGGGAVTAATTATDAQGQAQVKWTLGAKAGEQKVTAKVGALSAEFTATGTPDRPAKLALSPDSVVLGMDPGIDTASFRATVVDRHGNAIPDARLAWLSSDSTIARVNDQGKVSSSKAGRVTISAVADTIRATASALVKLQMNAQCKVPTAPPTRPGPARGMPNFAAETLPVRQDYPWVLPVALDADGDGDQDLLVPSNDWADPNKPYNGNTRMWRNDGRGGFTEATAVLLPGQNIISDYPRNFAKADFNGDGRVDVFVAQTGYDDGTPPFPGAPNLLFMTQPNGSLRETASTSLHPYDKNTFTHSASAADIDCDGDTDIFEGNWGSGVNQPHLQINSGAGAFTAEDGRLPVETFSQRSYAGVEFCDVDRDGDSDLALGGGQSDNALLLNNGFGRFRPARSDALPKPYFANNNEDGEIRCFDYDLDGWADIVISSVLVGTSQGQMGHLSLLRNNRDGTFTDVTVGRLPQTWDSPWANSGWIPHLFVVDINHDGWLDMVGSGWSVVRVYLNTGTGGFTEHRFPPHAGPNARVIPVDVDNDGRLDLLKSADPPTSPFFVLYRNRG